MADVKAKAASSTAASAAPRDDAPLITRESDTAADMGTTATSAAGPAATSPAYEWGERLSDGLTCALATSYGWQRKAGAGMHGTLVETRVLLKPAISVSVDSDILTRIVNQSSTCD